MAESHTLDRDRLALRLARAMSRVGPEVSETSADWRERAAVLRFALQAQGALEKLADLHEHFNVCTSRNHSDAYLTFIKGEDATWRAVYEALAILKGPAT